MGKAAVRAVRPGRTQIGKIQKIERVLKFRI